MQKNIAFLLFTLFSTNAFADAGGAAGGNPMGQFLILGIFVLVFYFLIMRPQAKRAKDHRNLISSIKKDDEVVTTGGILGKVTKVADGFLTISVSSDTELCIEKNAIAKAMPKGTLKSI